MDTYRKTVLDNGITVVTDTMTDLRSISLGLWFHVGSGNERADEAGLTHFMEHMMFKGTPTRSAIEISAEFDALGAELNAFTSKEYTCYYARFVDEKLESAASVLADMVCNSLFSQETIDPEREVVLEEIARTLDTPDDYVFDLFGQATLPGHPLGLPVLGTSESVSSFDTAICRRFHDEHYHCANMTVAAAGNVDHDALVALTKRLFASMPRSDEAPRAAGLPGERRDLVCGKQATEQAHVVYGVPWIVAGDERRYAAAMLSAILGGSMSSRLFSEVREKRGLVYAIDSHSASYSDVGLFEIYAGTRPENLAEVVAIIRREIAKFIEEGPTSDEIERTRESLCGRLLLGLESTSNRMVRIGREQMLDLPHRSVDEIDAGYRGVDKAAIDGLAAEYLAAEPSIAVISPLDESAVADAIAGEGE